jgi:hypothetical protein
MIYPTARKKEIINVSSQKDIMTIDSSFPHAFLIPDFSAALLFEKSADGVEPSTGGTRHTIERLEEAITILWIVRKTDSQKNAKATSMWYGAKRIRVITLAGRHGNSKGAESARSWLSMSIIIPFLMTLHGGQNPVKS